MRRLVWLGPALAGFFALVGPVAQGSTVRFTVLPEQSRVEFISGTQLGEFQGQTGQVNGEMVLDPQGAAAVRLAVVVDLRALRSDNAARDQHMREKFLEVARFPTATFTAGGFRPAPGAGTESGEGTLSGTLSLHGVERPVSMRVRFARNGTTLQGEGSLALNLGDFNLTPPRLLGLKVRDQVTVRIRLVAASG